MKKLFLVFTLAALLLLAGCIQLPGKTTGEERTGAGTQGGEQQAQGGEQEQEQQQVAGKEQTGGQQQNYDEMTMGALMKLGIPIKCTVKYNYAQEGISGIVTEYLSGKNIRMESQTTTSEGTASTIVVVKEDGMYMGTTPEMKTEGSMYANCDWMFYPTGEEETKDYEINEGETVGAMYKRLGYEYTYHCEPAMFGNEKFATPGKVCNIKEMMSNACASITDPDARAQCEAAYR
ncbi:MAG: hypothetical protein ACPL06_02465 [Candidatus Anstonellales archaeon]